MYWRSSGRPGQDADTSVTAAIGLNGWYGGYGADLSLFVRRGQPEATFTLEAGDRLLLSLEVDDPDQEVERLGAHGVEIVAGPRDAPGWGLRAAYIRDPDGNLLELMRQLPPGDWSPVGGLPTRQAAALD